MTRDLSNLDRWDRDGAPPQQESRWLDVVMPVGILAYLVIYVYGTCALVRWVS